MGLVSSIYRWADIEPPHKEPSGPVYMVSRGKPITLETPTLDARQWARKTILDGVMVTKKREKRVKVSR